MNTARVLVAAFACCLTMTATVSALDSGDCTDYVDLSGLPLPIHVTGTTSGLTNDYGPFPARPACWQLPWYTASGSSRDKTYKWTAPHGGHFNISLLGSSYDTCLLLYGFTCPIEPSYPEDFICGNDDAGEMSQSELYYVELSAGQEVLVVVDGRGSSAGSFHLRISEYAPAADLNTFITTTMETYHIAGVSACAVRDGDTIWSGNYGYANIAQQIEPADTTLFLLASVSKTVTGVALMQLWERGFFELDDDINGYLPWAVHNPYYPDSVITFQMLLSHTSAIVDNWTILDALHVWGGDSPIPLGEFLYDYLVPAGTYYRLANFGNYPPGTRFSYSSVAVSLAGYLVETINPGGLAFEDYTQEFIFEPLGMNKSAWFLADLNVEDIAVPYFWSTGGFGAYQHYGSPDGPAGNLRTSSAQLARFLIMFMQHGQLGGTRILDSTTVEMMTTVQSEDPALGNSYGLIWAARELGGRTLWGHAGAWYGCETNMYYCPEENTGVIVLTNSESSYGRLRITNELFGYANPTSASPEQGGSSISGPLVLCGSRPNPVGPSTEITYYLPAACEVRMGIYNVLGQRVATLFEGQQGSGTHCVQWDSRKSAAGVYYARLKTSDQTRTGKLLLVR